VPRAGMREGAQLLPERIGMAALEHGGALGPCTCFGAR
jgi:hypothetical protein